MSSSTIKNVKMKPGHSSHISGSFSRGVMRKNRGFTLLEAMVGFLVLSVGMLGIASLQGISLKAGTTSVYGSVAMMKVEELFESMRINSTAVADYAGTDLGAGSGTNNSCSTANCSPAELAQDDLFWWGKNLTAGLPAGATAVVTVTAPVAPSKMATVTIALSWDERNKDSNTKIGREFTTTSSICTGSPC